tara:strand:- start:3887 stop:4546 length:660 start_codon:yes stop_codon:yes gene_type:complete
MEETLHNLTNNKSIILVGNSVEILQHQLADYIESFDTVVRFGNGIPDATNWDSIGKRTDIWVTGYLRYGKRKMFAKDCAVLFNRSRIHLGDDVDSRHQIDFKYVNMFSDKELMSLFKLCGSEVGKTVGARPSAGFIAIQYFLQKTKFSSLTLVGFDFFSKALPIIAGTNNPYSWHIPLNTVTSNPHSPKEKEIVVDLYERGVIDWKILTDLDESYLDLS